MTTWRKLIEGALAQNKETWNDMVACTLNDEGLDVQFDAGFNLTEGSPFTMWTANYVYFPLECEGAEGVGSVPRNPCDKATTHQGV